MKRVTVLFDDERLYRELKAEAAREGRAVKDVVAEALGDWLQRRSRPSPADQSRIQAVLLASDELREEQREREIRTDESIEDALEALRVERS